MLVTCNEVVGGDDREAVGLREEERVALKEPLKVFQLVENIETHPL